MQYQTKYIKMGKEKRVKEYCIYCRYNGGTPFIQGIYKNLEAAQRQIYDMVALEEERERIYFVDNDFF